MLKTLSILSLSALVLSACASNPQNSNPLRATASEATPSSAAEIYGALNMRGIDGRPVDESGAPSVGADILQKSVGGLICQSITVVVPGAQATYSCTLSSGMDASAIYKALNVQEVDARPTFNGRRSLGADILGKTAGGLTCKKTTVVVPNAKPTFSCLLTF